MRSKTVHLGAALAALVLLYGCAAPASMPTVSDYGTGMQSSPVSGKPLARVKTTVALDRRLLETCSDLPPMSAENPGPEDVLAQKILETKLYSTCRLRHAALVRIVLSAFNLDFKPAPNGSSTKAELDNLSNFNPAR